VTNVNLRVRLLGSLEVRRDGQLVGPGVDATKQRALLLLLAVHANHVLSKDGLIDALWIRPPASARNLIEKYVSVWRKSLDPGRLETVAQGYLLHLSAEECDLELVKHRLKEGRAAAAVDDYERAELELRAAFDAWAEPDIEDITRDLLPAGETQRLVDLYLHVLQEWSFAALTAGTDISVAEPLRDALTKYPFSERLAELLMWAHYQQGRQDEATRLYARTRRLLAVELGHDPGQSLESMHSRVLRRDDSLNGLRRPALARITNLPPRNRRFTGRVELLEEIARRMRPRADRSSPPGVAVWGLVGAGKSALALEFAHRHREQYDCIWWVNATTRASTAAGLEALASRLGCPLPADRDPHLYQLWDELRRFRRWLLILDNAAGTKELSDYWPPTGTGDIIATSLHPEWGSYASPVEVGVFRPVESVDFLSQRIASTDPATETALVAELGHLPLAIEQAAAYMGQTGMTAAEYLPLFRRRRGQLLQRGAPDDHSGTIDTTWRLARAELEALSAAHVQLLDLCAFLAPEDIPIALLRTDPDSLPVELRTTVSDDLLLEDAISEIRKYSLLTRAQDRLTMHCLVQAVVASSLSSSDRAAWQRRAAQLELSWAPGTVEDRATWPTWELLVPHIRVCAAAMAEAGKAPDGFIDLLHRASSYLVSRASFAEAGRLLRDALSIGQAMSVDQQSPEIGRTLTELGEVLERTGDLKGALSAQERALAILQRSYGPDDPWVARALGRLGNVLTCHHGVTLWKPDELDEAERRFIHALTVLESAWGPVHPVVAHTLSGLGQVRQDRGDLATGQACQERALQILQACYGPDHPDVGHMLDKLGFVLGLRGDFARSRACHERGLAILENSFGTDAVDIGWTLSNLGMLLLETGGLGDALAYQQRAHALFEAKLNQSHPTQITAWRLAKVYLRMGDLERARELLEAALPRLEDQLGPTHADVVGMRADLHRAVDECRSRQLKI